MTDIDTAYLPDEEVEVYRILDEEFWKAVERVLRELGDAS